MQATLFAEWVKEERNRRGITQRDLADISGVHHSTIAQVEQGSREPTADFVVKVCEAFECSPKETLNHLHEIGVRKNPVDLGDAADDWFVVKVRKYARGASREAIEKALVLFETGIKLNSK